MLQALQEFDQRAVGCLRVFLLDPVALLGNQDHSAKIRNERTHQRLKLLFGCATNDHVAGARDEQRRHFDREVFALSGELPVALEVAVVVDTTSEAGALKLTDDVVEILLSEPIW